jgi:hypothetical protein
MTNEMDHTAKHAFGKYSGSTFKLDTYFRSCWNMLPYDVTAKITWRTPTGESQQLIS